MIVLSEMLKVARDHALDDFQSGDLTEEDAVVLSQHVSGLCSKSISVPPNQI